MVEDVDGNIFIDLGGCIGVQSVGYSDPEIVAAVQEQAGRFFHTTISTVTHEPYVELAEKLNAMIPGERVKKTVFLNSGAESVEAAMRIARFYKNRPAVVTTGDSFHHRTLLSMTIRGRGTPFEYGFGPSAPEVYRVPAPYCYRCAFDLTYPECDLRCAQNVERVINLDISANNVACFIAAPVLGEGGFVVPPPGYHKCVREICTANGILYIDDESQTGWARTGTMLAIQHYDVIPDIVVTAKSLAAGLPLSAVTGASEIMDAVNIGGIAGSYSGNPLACVSALRAIEILERDGYCDKSRVLGERLLSFLRELKGKWPAIGDVRGLGALAAVEFVQDPDTKEPAVKQCHDVVRECLRRGVVLGATGRQGNAIRILVPIVISDKQLAQAFAVIEDSVAAVFAR